MKEINLKVKSIEVFGDSQLTYQTCKKIHILSPQQLPMRGMEFDKQI